MQQADGENSGRASDVQDALSPVQDRTREYFIIREEESGGRQGSKEDVECRLEQALEKGYPLIIIEPVKLGTMTIKWIRFGNFLHKSAVLACLGSLVTLPVLPHSITNFSSLPLGVMGVACAGLYDVSWQFDPCSQYQVDYMGTELATVPSLDLHSQTPVVLVRKNDKYRKRLHNTLALIVLGYLGWRLYKFLKDS